MQIKGTHTALITPFNPDYSVDYDSFKKLIELQITAGVEGIVIMGTTGEAPTIEDLEMEKIFDFASSTIAGRCICTVGTSSNVTKKTIEENKLAAKCNADAVLISSPYYNKPTQKGLIEHYTAISEQTDLPIMLYNVPGRTAVNIDVDTVAKLSELKNIVAIKEASGDLEQVKAVIANTADDFNLLSGNDDQNLEIIKLGGTGAVSVASNPIPKIVKQIIDLGLAGEFDAAEKINSGFAQFFEDIFIENNPTAIKTLMAHLGHCEEVLRLPLTTMEAQNKAKLIASWDSVQTMLKEV